MNHALSKCLKRAADIWSQEPNTHTSSPVSEPAAFEEDVTATNCLDLTGFCTPEEIKQEKTG